MFSDLKTRGKRKNQIPNVLSMSRLLAPVCIIPAVLTGNFPVAVSFAIIFSLTDVADGVIARRLKLNSGFGKDLDAMTDKVLSTTLIGVAALITPIVLINLAFEGAISLVNYKSKKANQEPVTSFVGRVKTWSLAIVTMLSLLLPIVDVSKVFVALFGATTLLQALTVTNYVYQYEKRKKLQEKTSPEYSSQTIDIENEQTKENDKSKIAQLTEMKQVLLDATEIDTKDLDMNKTKVKK